MRFWAPPGQLECVVDNWTLAVRLWRTPAGGGMMRCDTCKKDSPVVMRVVIAKDYNRSLSRPLFNCPDCFERKEETQRLQAAGRKSQAGPSSDDLSLKLVA